MAKDDNFVFPRIPEKNWWTLRDQFKKSIPREATIGYLKSLLQLSTDSAARSTLGPLKKLGLLDDDNRPTDLANDWRNDDKYSDACQQMLEIYPQELRDLFSSSDVDKSRIENWFRDKGRLGDSAARQSATLYLLLLEAEPRSSAEYASTKKTPSSDSKKKTSKAKPAASSEPTAEKTVAEPQTVPFGSVRSSDDKVKNWFSLHIDLQIHISPEADAAQIDNIFASMAKHIMSMKRAQSGDEGN